MPSRPVRRPGRPSRRTWPGCARPRPWSRWPSCCPDGTPVGIATFLRIDHANGTAEVGYISYSSALQRTTAATEAMYLMAAHAFDVVGVRRYEWKCDSLNAAFAPAQRPGSGFTYEGTFRQAAGLQGPQPRHRLVRHHRRRVAARSGRPSRPGSTRRTSTTTDANAHH